MNNPFDKIKDPHRHEIWHILVQKDADAFIANDWAMTEVDFDAENFYGIDAKKSSRSEDWSVCYSSLAEYRDEWLRQRALFSLDDCANNPKDELMAAMNIHHIEIKGNRAVAHKTFDGQLTLKSGKPIALNWKTLYYLVYKNNAWKIVGFTGYLPHHPTRCKVVPEKANQHITAGPYSPVLEVRGNKIVVISGQAAIDKQGYIIGSTIEEQTELTLKNCIEQLSYAQASLADVFKVNVFLTNLEEWPRFNVVYQKFMPEPLPVRTAVQTGLLGTLKVEIEMWAMLKD